MSTWWEILEVERGADLRTIKRAYSKKLKTIHQEDDPEAFMELREAYEDAKHHTEHNKKNSAPKSLQNEHAPNNHKSTDIAIPQIPLPPAKLLMEDVKNIFKNPLELESTGIWSNLLEDARLDGLDDLQDFENLLFDFLLTEHGYFTDDNSNSKPLFSPKIAEMIFSKFGWERKQGPYEYLVNIYQIFTANEKLKSITANANEKIEDAKLDQTIALILLIPAVIWAVYSIINRETIPRTAIFSSIIVFDLVLDFMLANLRKRQIKFPIPGPRWFRIFIVILIMALSHIIGLAAIIWYFFMS